MFHHCLHLCMNALLSATRRILDIPCKVCGDFSSGKHYNIFACDGCAGFFKRSIRRNRRYVCKAKEEGACIIDRTHRNQCRACRLAKCQEAGMNKDAVQHERGPRTSTLRRQQMSNFFGARDSMFISSSARALNLAAPKAVSPPVDIAYPLAVPPSGTLPGAYDTIMGMPRLSIPASTLIPSPLLNPAMICESAARLLFMNVQWTKSISHFTSMLLQDQLVLLEESWRELFILGAAQFLPVTELSPLVYSCGVLDRIFNKTLFFQQVQQFEEVLSNIRQFQPDNQEYACLRAIALFKTSLERTSSETSPDSTSSPEHSQHRSLTDCARIASIQDDTQLALSRYISSVHPGQPLRFGKLLLLLPTLKNVSGETIEDLFFRKTIGNIPIVRIISDMYKSH
ncbi:unnamed protein product [Callosobruchus maculatus]|uniref:Nuclear receptor subfamily 2 group E member 1 n=1 Tax=Callosobruchus maculatus TaxID=64391 RepID=A0A653CBI7_CALMS|nr:unnamed protein product [Callosobruchus maculatus]